MAKEMNIENTIKKNQELLLENLEWKERYSRYAKILSSNIDNDFIKNNRGQFNEFSPLRFYITTTNATKKVEKRLELSVRYCGQIVATLTAKPNGIITISTKDKVSENLRDFDCNIELKDVSWKSTTATEFRKHFKDRMDTRNNTKDNKGNEEHNVESLLLTEFSKRNSKEKQILDIPDKSFEKDIYTVGNDKIECHYIYFKYDGKKLSNFQTSLSDKQEIKGRTKQCATIVN